MVMHRRSKRYNVSRKFRRMLNSVSNLGIINSGNKLADKKADLLRVQASEF